MSRSPAADEYVALCGSTVVTVPALMALGVPRSTIASRCRAGGPWMWLMPSVLTLNNAPPTWADRRRAALLHAGDDSLITGLDALELHGMSRMPPPSGPVNLLVPAASRRTGHGISLLERTDRLPLAGAGRWPLAPPARAVLDACRRLRRRDQVRARIAEAVQTGRCGVGALAAELEAGSQCGSACRDRYSPRSRRARVRRPRLPSSTCCAARTSLSPEDHERTLEPHNALIAAGVPVLRSLPSHLPTRRSDDRARLREARTECARSPLRSLPASPHRPH